ncbi:MAG TPA: hypothetical protein VGA64_09480, partial [Candidatus Polarisedimenticolia bacterium]
GPGTNDPLGTGGLGATGLTGLGTTSGAMGSVGQPGIGQSGLGQSGIGATGGTTGNDLSGFGALGTDATTGLGTNATTGLGTDADGKPIGAGAGATNGMEGNSTVFNPLFPNNGVSNGSVTGGLTDQNAAVPPTVPRTRARPRIGTTATQ